MSEDQLKVEVDWCLARLEEKLAAMDPYSRPAQEAAKVHRILKSSKAPVIKKRQAMRNMFGDYRAKMKAMEKKNLSAMKKSTLVAVKDAPNESKFLRRSTGAAVGQNSSNDTSDAGASSSTTASAQEQCVNSSSDSAANTGTSDKQAAEPSASQNHFPVSSNSAEEFKFGFDGSESVVETGATGEGAVSSASDSTSKNYFVLKPTNEEFRFNFAADGCGEET